MKAQKTTQIGLLDKIKNQLQNVRKKSPERSINKSVVYKSKKQLNSSNGNFANNSYYYAKKDKNSLNQESFYQKNSTEKKNRSRIEHSKSPSPEAIHEKNTLTTEITSEINRAVFQLKSYVNQEFDNNFFKEVIQDITNLITILNNIALESANITSELNEKIFKLEGEKDKLTLQNKELNYQIQEFRNKHKLSVLSDLSSQLFGPSDLHSIRDENLRLSQENKKLIEIAKHNNNSMNYSGYEEPSIEKGKSIKNNGENQNNNDSKDFGHYTFKNKNNNDYTNFGSNLSITNNNNKGLYAGANQAFNSDLNSNAVAAQNMNNMHFFYSLNNGTGITRQRNKSIEKSVIFDDSQGEVINRKNPSSNEETKRKFKYIRPRK